jgi:hypothetical protein
MAAEPIKHRGIVYSATGQFWLNEAINSARTSRRFNPVPHLIYSDLPSSEAIDGVEFGRYEPSGDPFLDKISSIRRSPFAQTLYLDTDTYVTANLDELFDLLDRFDIAAAHAQGYMKHPEKGQSEAFYDFNTGVIAFSQTPGVAELLARWSGLHEQWTTSPPFAMLTVDQAAFRRAVWDSGLSVYVLGPEYNYRPQFPGRLVGPVKIIHGRSDDHAKLAAYLNAETRPRVFPRIETDRVW